MVRLFLWHYRIIFMPISNRVKSLIIYSIEKKDLYKLLEGIDLKCELIIESLTRISTDPDFLITSLRSIAEKQKKSSANSSGKLFTMKIVGKNGNE